MFYNDFDKPSNISDSFMIFHSIHVYELMILYKITYYYYSLVAWLKQQLHQYI